MSLLEVRNLRASYGRIPVLHQIDFSVNAGEIVGVVGHNGMGKTTLLRCLMGHLKTNAGTILLRDRDVQGLSAHKRARLGVTLVPQGRDIFGNLTVHENLMLGAFGTQDQSARIDEMISIFPRLADLLDRKGGALSGGEQQILALARALCNRPSLLLLDEPTEGVQPSIVLEMATALKSISQTENLAVILVEQNIAFIQSLAERVYTISNGVIEQELSVFGPNGAALITEALGF
ncbi:ABC transporter ATP-binding protein [Ruegeria arenilitoris]|uniref:ABC transporter ATP-binding protein n=1 Tax=Ruegeria arenilitoris TaxID=1173585 RepID=UPI001479885D|nr:ABC transporter ATP-binding protein [Ruegeria arenilitoris]